MIPPDPAVAAIWRLQEHVLGYVPRIRLVVDNPADYRKTVRDIADEVRVTADVLAAIARDDT